MDDAAARFSKSLVLEMVLSEPARTESGLSEITATELMLVCCSPAGAQPSPVPLTYTPEFVPRITALADAVMARTSRLASPSFSAVKVAPLSVVR